MYERNYLKRWGGLAFLFYIGMHALVNIFYLLVLLKLAIHAISF